MLRYFLYNFCSTFLPTRLILISSTWWSYGSITGVPFTAPSFSCENYLIVAAIASSPNILMPLIALICVNVTFTARLHKLFPSSLFICFMNNCTCKYDPSDLPRKSICNLSAPSPFFTLLARLFDSSVSDWGKCFNMTICAYVKKDTWLII